jgi:hypothetical protein
MIGRSIFFGLVVSCSSLRAANDVSNPFCSVVRRGDAVVATVAAGHKWVVSEGRSGPIRDVLEGESFYLKDGEWLWFFAEAHPTHVIFRFRGHLSPEPAGLQVEQRFDGHSSSSYFIKAQ